MNSYTITTVLHDETIYKEVDKHKDMDLDAVLEIQRKRLESHKDIHRIVVYGRGIERVVTRHDTSKSANQLLTETLKNVFSL